MDNVSAPATASFTVDTAAPTAAITIVPGNAADHTTAVTVVLSEPGTFTCALDGAPVALRRLVHARCRRPRASTR